MYTLNNPTGWINEAMSIASPNHNARPSDVEVDLLIIHCISLPPGRYDNTYIADFFCNQLPIEKDPYFETIRDLKVSAHFMIDRTGQLQQFVSVYDRAWHAGLSNFQGRDNCNDYSLGIELQGTVDESFTFEQYQTLKTLTLLLGGCFPKLNCDRIVGHSQVAVGRKDDPGPFFDWAYFLGALKESGFN